MRTEQVYFPNLVLKSIVPGNEQSFLEIYDPNLKCQECAQEGCYFIEGEKFKIGSCLRHNDKWVASIFRDATEIAENYCKRCGSSLDEHDDEFCHCNKYPALLGESKESFFQTAEKFGIDLTNANQKQADGGRHGAIEGDINANICQAIETYIEEDISEPLVEYVKSECLGWGDDYVELARAMDSVNWEAFS